MSKTNNIIGKKCKELVPKLDLFKVAPEFNFEGKTKIWSAPGFMMTGLIFLFIIAFAIQAPNSITL